MERFWETVYNELMAILPGSVEKDVVLAPFTSFKLGGPARLLITVNTDIDLLSCMHYLGSRSLPYFILGGGSNLLISDRGYDGVIVKLEGDFLKTDFCEGNYVWVGCGCFLPRLQKRLIKAGLSGLEFATGIPGTIGGALFMNAGAWKHYFSEIVKSFVTLGMDGNLGYIKATKDMWGYREFYEHHRIFLRALFKLRPEHPAKIKEKMSGYMRERKKKQPIGLRTAGSVFRNPEDNPAFPGGGCRLHFYYQLV